jgi:hypothetical protein
MELKGRFNSCSKSGHTLDVLKSAMQKFARRGETKLMMQAVNEIDLFRELMIEDTPNVRSNAFIKAIRTNMINRLSIILFEDVSFSEYYAFEKVIANINEWKRDRSKTSCLMEICKYISKAKKLRHPSHLLNYFRTRYEQVTEEEFLHSIQTGEYEPGFAFIFHHEARAFQLLLLTIKELTEPMKFAIGEYKRLKTTSKPIERLIFLIVPWLWVTFKTRLTIVGEINIEVNISEEPLTLPDYVYDMHTLEGKKRGKTHADFVEEGSFVVNEDLDFLVPKFKDCYKKTIIPVPNKKSRSHPKNLKIKNQPKNWHALIENSRLLTDGVCGRKLPCVDIGTKILKQVKDLDYLFVNSQKARFGIRDFKMKMVHSDRKLVSVGRKQYEWQPGTALFCVMEKIDHKGDLGKQKHLLENETKFDEMIAIRLFNGLFNTSDNILRNILVDHQDNFYTIDEHDLLGSRKSVFNKTEPIKKSRFFTWNKVQRLIKAMKIKEKIEDIINDMVQYGFEHKIDQFKQRANNYEEIVMVEMGLEF